MISDPQTSISDCMHERVEERKKRVETPLVLGFAYSLTPTGAPGSYNQELAKAIIERWKGEQAWIGVQWEICDAIRGRIGEEAFGSLNIHTVPPFSPIEGKDIVEWKAFRKWLQNSLESNGDPAVAILARAVAKLARQAGHTVTADLDLSKPDQADAALLQAALYGPEQIALYLNRLIQTEDDFYKQFWNGEEAIVELHDRQRPGFGPVGFEKRELPAADETVGPYQKQRVNRLIIDALCPERSILSEPGYLSTRGVLEQLFREMPHRGKDFDWISIYGSPVHSARCERQFIEFAWSVGWFVSRDQIRVVYCGKDMQDCGWAWDPKTAQVWCRSKAAWDAYETNNARLR